MSFLYPGWFSLLLILPFILLGAILVHRSREKTWMRMVAPRLRKQLVREGSSTRLWISLFLGLLGCALIITAITRPYKGETITTETITSRNILIAVDTSRSMLVRDGSPDRMATAKAMALELVEAFPDDRIGVIAFAGAPVLMVPLTIDHMAVHETISQLDTQVIPSGGSDLYAAVQLAIDTFRKTGQKSNALIIISDGEDHSEKTSIAASQIREAGIAVCTIGVGSTEGGMIPDPSKTDDKFRDNQGHTVHSRMIPDALDQLARAGRGTFVPASSGADTAIRSALSYLKSNQQQGRKISVPVEKYQWWLFPAIILLALSQIVRSHLFSKKIPNPTTASTVIAGIILLGSTLHTHATTHIDRAKAAYERKDYESALDFFNKALKESHGEDRRAIQFSQGSSAYRLQQWDDANRHFSRALLSQSPRLQAESHYNLGNSLFQSGWAILNLPDERRTLNPFLELMRKIFLPKKQQKAQYLTKSDVQRVITHWKDAITHYNATLKLQPDHQDAAYNRREVEKLLKLLQDAFDQASKEINGGEERQNPGQSDKEKNDQNDGEQGDGNDPQQNPDENNKGKKKDDPNAGDNKNPNSPKDPKDDPNKDSKDMQQKPGESKEAFAARILKDLSDAETRPVKRRFIRLRRPAKDW